MRIIAHAKVANPLFPGGIKKLFANTTNKHLFFLLIFFVNGFVKMRRKIIFIVVMHNIFFTLYEIKKT